MIVSAVLTSEVSGDVVDFGHVSPEAPLILDESMIRRIEAKRGMPIGNVPLPRGVVFTLVIDNDSEAESSSEPRVDNEEKQVEGE